VVFTMIHDAAPRWEEAQLAVQSLVTGERKMLGDGADARYVPTGHLVYVRAGTLMAVPFDVTRLEVTGGAVNVVSDVMQAARMPNPASNSGGGQFSVSASGALVYVPGGIVPGPERSLVWVDRTGATQPLSAPPGAYLMPRLSPDGQRLAVFTGQPDCVWVYEIPRGTLRRLTTDEEDAWNVWTPDGKRVVFASGPGARNLFWKPADASGSAERLTTSDYDQVPSSWSPDGQTLAFVQFHPITGNDILTLSVAGDRRPRALLETGSNEQYPEFSPDGRWLAYTSDESGRAEVYVQPYPGRGPRQQVTVDGATAPAWARNGRELFYRAAGDAVGLMKIMAVPVTTRPTFTAGASRMLFQGRYSATYPVRGYDVTPDGRRFLMAQQQEPPSIKVTQMVLVQNWFEELKRRVRTR
jgi:hypothetical protein